MAAIELPSTVGFTSREFQPAYKQQMSPSGGGNLQTIERSVPLWRAQYTTPPLVGTPFDDMNSFFDQLNGSLNTFLGYDPKRVMPKAYASASLTSDPWTQTGQAAPRVTSATYSTSLLTIDRLQNGAIIAKGDYISFFDGIAWWLFRSTQADVTVTGNAATITVSPRPNDLASTTFAVRYRKAVAEMKMIGALKESGQVGTGQTFNFTAVQYIRKYV